MIYENDSYLKPYEEKIKLRLKRIEDLRNSISSGASLSSAINNHMYYGLHKDAKEWVFREYAPNATRIYLIGDFNNWKRTSAYQLQALSGGDWELRLSERFLHEGQHYKIYIEWPGGAATRLPAYLTRAVQDEYTKDFTAQVIDDSKQYKWKYSRASRKDNPLIYECHIGMSSEEEEVANFDYFRINILPKVAKLGYNTIQIMALQEHPYYGSFGYQVSNFFALSSRFGSIDSFKALVDEAHRLDIAVVMDIVHSHSVSNEAEGLSLFDGKDDLYFYSGEKGYHPAWGSRCFNYSKSQTIYFLLSNCKYWLETFNLDGFRFDGVTSMLYWDHGLGKDFVGYDNYFNEGVDESAVAYLALANMLIKEIYPDAITIAEDVSGMPGLATSFEEGGIGFDFRMAMGVADHWIKWIKEKSDEQWSMGEIYYELSNKREDERTISYAECHDQALVGDKTIIFRLIDKEMYTAMNKSSNSLIVDRGVALHKMIRLLTLVCAGDGYLNFMGNEFGHPEWIDFPREGNNWSYKYARRQWSLAEPDYLRYKYLRDFDEVMIQFFRTNKILSEKAISLRLDEQKQVLIIERKNCIFVFNFSPNNSYQDYGFNVAGGEYHMCFNTDESRFDGFSRLQDAEVHYTVDDIFEHEDAEASQSLYLYIPSRSALVLKKKLL